MGSPKNEVRWLFGLSPLMWGILSGLAAIAIGALMLASGSAGQTIAGGVCFVVAGAVFAGAGIFRYIRPTG